MIDFTTTQLSWIVVGACTIGSTGYMTMNEKIDNLSQKVGINNAHMEHNTKTMEQFQRQLDRIEEKIDSKKANR